MPRAPLAQPAGTPVPSDAVSPLQPGEAGWLHWSRRGALAHGDGGGSLPAEGCSERPAGALLNAAIPGQPLPAQPGQAADAAGSPSSAAEEKPQFCEFMDLKVMKEHLL